MALKCTKTSGPPSREMKPNPFASLNHFTVPVMRAIETSLGMAMFASRKGKFHALRRSAHRRAVPDDLRGASYIARDPSALTTAQRHLRTRRRRHVARL